MSRGKRVRQAQCDLSPGFDQLDEGISYYCKTDNPVTRRSHTRDQDLKLFKEKQLVGINLRGAQSKRNRGRRHRNNKRE